MSHYHICSGKVLDNVHLYPIPTPSDQDHRDGDLVSIHEKICSILSNIKHQDTHAISEKERRDVKEWRNQQMVSVFITQLNTAYVHRLQKKLPFIVQYLLTSAYQGPRTEVLSDKVCIYCKQFIIDIHTVISLLYTLRTFPNESDK